MGGDPEVGKLLSKMRSCTWKQCFASLSPYLIVGSPEVPVGGLGVGRRPEKVGNLCDFSLLLPFQEGLRIRPTIPTTSTYYYYYS